MVNIVLGSVCYIIVPTRSYSKIMNLVSLRNIYEIYAKQKTRPDFQIATQVGMEHSTRLICHYIPSVKTMTQIIKRIDCERAQTQLQPNGR